MVEAEAGQQQEQLVVYPFASSRHHLVRSGPEKVLVIHD